MTRFAVNVMLELHYQGHRFGLTRWRWFLTLFCDRYDRLVEE